MITRVLFFLPGVLEALDRGTAGATVICDIVRQREQRVTHGLTVDQESFCYQAGVLSNYTA